MTELGPLDSAALPPGVRSRFVPDINGLRVHLLEAGERLPTGERAHKRREGALERQRHVGGPGEHRHGQVPSITCAGTGVGSPASSSSSQSNAACGSALTPVVRTSRTIGISSSNSVRMVGFL